MTEIKRVVMVKQNGRWEAGYTETDPAAVYHQLAADMIHKKLHRCSYITKIDDLCNYDGTRTITVHFNNNTKNVYTVEA